MSLAALIMTSAEALEPCLTELRERLGVEAEVASSRRAALQALTRREYAVLLLDQAMVEADVEGAELLWKQAGLAIPVQVNLALSSPARIVREVRAALVRREQEMSLSLRAAAAAVDTEIKNAVTALLLQSQLALSVEGLAPAAREKVAQVVQLAEGLRGKLETAQGPESVALKPSPVRGSRSTRMGDRSRPALLLRSLQMRVRIERPRPARAASRAGETPNLP